MQLQTIYRFIKNLCKLLLVILPLEIIGWIILLIYLPIHFKLIQLNIRKSIELPYLLRWFDNADSYLNRDISSYLVVFGNGWWNTYTWLAWRNPLNYFGYKVLGFQSQAAIPDIDIGNTTNSHAGYYYLQSQGYYEYCYIYKWSNTKCVRIRYGWKLNNTQNGDYVQWVCAIQPYIDYSGL